MGEVYRARDERLKRDVAIKVLPAELANDPDFLARFEREARAASSINHPNILAIHDLGTHDGSTYIVSELLDGETLRARIKAGPIPPRKAIDLARQIATGLGAAHARSIIHRDLKPENVFLTADGHVKILDFGLAKIVTGPMEAMGETAPAEETRPGAIMGTAGYMAPEQVQARAVDARADIFAFGVMLHEMIAGSRPFKGDSAMDVAASILRDDAPPLPDAALDRIVQHCLEKKPADRFQSARDLVFALDALTQLSSASSASRVDIPAAPPARSRWPLIAAAVGLVAAGLAGAFVLGAHTQRGPAPKTIVAPAPPSTSAPPMPSFQLVASGTAVAAYFAPKSDSVLIETHENGRTMLVEQRIGAQSKRTVIDDWNLESVSADGQLLVLKDDQLGSLSLDGAAGLSPRPLASGVDLARWAPDRSLLVLRHNGLELGGRSIYQSTARIRWPKISPDGKRVAFVEQPFAEQDDRGEVMVVDDAGARRLTPEYGSTSGLAWSPSGDEIWFTAAEASASTELLAVDLTGKVRTVFRGPMRLGVTDVAADGRAIVFTEQGHATLYLSVHDKTKTIDVPEDTEILDVSADGETMLTETETSPEPEYAIRVQHGDQITEIGQGIEGRLSPDGKLVVASSLEHHEVLTIFPVGPGEPRQLVTGGLVKRTNPEFLPDGKQVVYTGATSSGESRIFVQALDGDPRPIGPTGIALPAAFGNPVSPDGMLFFAEDKDGWVIVPNATDGKLTPIAGAKHGDHMLGWTADGKRLWCLHLDDFFQSPVLSQLDPSTGERTPSKFPIQLGPEDHIPRALISADGTIMATRVLRFFNEVYVATGLH
jgi:Tol biopolymer transport system component